MGGTMEAPATRALEKNVNLDVVAPPGADAVRRGL